MNMLLLKLYFYVYATFIVKQIRLKEQFIDNQVFLYLLSKQHHLFAGIA